MRIAAGRLVLLVLVSAGAPALAGGLCATPNACDDGRTCTVDECTNTVGCLHRPLACDDGDLCTIDTCTEPAGCTSRAIDVQTAAAAIPPELAPEACAGERRARRITRSFRSAARRILRAAETSEPRRAGRLVRKATKRFGKAERRLARSSGKLSESCATALLATVSEARQIGLCLEAQLIK